MKLRFVTWHVGQDGRGAGESCMRQWLGFLGGLDADVIAVQDCAAMWLNGRRLAFQAEVVLGARGFLAPATRCVGLFVRESAGLRVVREDHAGGLRRHGIAVVSVRPQGWAVPLHLVSAHLARPGEAAEFGQAVAAEDGPVIAGVSWSPAPAPGITGPPIEDGIDQVADATVAAAGLGDIAVQRGDLTPTAGGGRLGRLYTTVAGGTVTHYEVVQEGPGDHDGDARPVLAEIDLAAVAAAPAASCAGLL